MISLGQILLSIPFSLSLIYFIKGVKNTNNDKYQLLSDRFTAFIFFTTLTSFFFLIYKYYISDFYYENIFTNSHTKKPLIYKISGSWGNHEGSMLLFLCILSFFSWLYSKKSKLEQKPLILSIQNLIYLLLAFYIYFFSSPFEINPLIEKGITPNQGRGLNPILQDIGLAIHPPILYFGFAGYSLIFSISLIALKKKIEGRVWCSDIKSWSLITWSLLTLGVGLGSWWAYRELGWGGFWFWDPVENISIIPWLLGTAFLHSLLYTKKFEGAYKLTIYLGISTFIAALIGFFLVRSGILSSVHSFASDPQRGIVLLLIVAILVFYSLVVNFKYSSKISFKSVYPYNLASRQFLILSNAVFYITLALTLLLSLFYPIISQLFFEKAITVGEPYFIKVFLPIILFASLFMIFTPYYKWHINKVVDGINKTGLSFSASLLVVALIQYFYSTSNEFSFLELSGLFIGLWLIASLLEVLIVKVIKKEKLGKGYVAMIISHIGFGTAMISVSLLSMFEFTKELQISENESIIINDKKLTFYDSVYTKENNYIMRKNYFALSEPKEILYFAPEERMYFPDAQKTYEVDIKRNFLNDYYLVTSGTSDVEAYSKNKEKVIVRYYEKPFINLLWLSILVIICGALVSAYNPKKQNS